jgi:hypothetical protein
LAVLRLTTSSKVVQLAIVIGRQRKRDRHRFRALRFLQLSQGTLGSRIVRVHEEGYHLGLGNQFGQQLEPLGYQRSMPTPKTIGIVEVALFAANAGVRPPLATIASTLRPTRSAANAGKRS